MHPEGLKFHVRNSKGTIGGQFYIAESVIREWWNKSFHPLSFQDIFIRLDNFTFVARTQVHVNITLVDIPIFLKHLGMP